MAEIIYMTALSPTMTEGTIARWKKSEGDGFASGDLLLEVETDKASMDYEAPKSASLLKILLPAGGKAKVGDPIGIIGKKGEDTAGLMASLAEKSQPSSMPDTPPAQPPANQVIQDVSARLDAAIESHNAKEKLPHAAKDMFTPVSPVTVPPSSPLARKLAKELGIDLRAVKGSGPQGRVVKRDVEAFAVSPRTQTVQPDVLVPQPQSAPAKIPVSGKRAVIARRLSESFFTAPHYYLKKKVSAEKLLALRQFSAELAQSTEKASLNALLMKLAAEALKRHPEINVHFASDYIEQFAATDIALAVALDDGLITPVVRDCADKSVRQIDTEMKALIEKARTKGLAPSEYEGGTFTITNLGSFGIDEFTAIINPPGSAILAVGAIKKEAVPQEDGSIGVISMMTLTLGCDHRSIDGAVGARFLKDLALFIEEPASVLL